jgi:hypothetical protein
LLSILLVHMKWVEVPADAGEQVDMRFGNRLGKACLLTPMRRSS